jgi:1-pyrroline-5-carboxylate dehydrogenase
MSGRQTEIIHPVNETVLGYLPGSAERAALKAELMHLRGETVDIPLVIGGQDVRSGEIGECRVPHDHQHRLGTYQRAGENQTRMAIDAAADAAPGWARTRREDRLAIFQKAAELISGPYRMQLNAATMLGQGKNVFQAEIDAACELADFLRFNAHYAAQIYRQQPLSVPGERNQLEYRPLEGFVLAISPFNFTAIAGNLAAAPAMLGNTVLWKPASSAVYSAHLLMTIFQEAGLPDGVINFLPGAGSDIAGVALQSPTLAGVHFTGSTAVFQSIWQTIGGRISHYRNYPRIVGETGGKDFVILHPSADPRTAVTALVRGAFEYQGQKCSAASRAYVPQSLWETVRAGLTATMDDIKMGSPEDFSTFVNAVIDQAAFDKINAVLDDVRSSPDAKILAGGGSDDKTGYFIEPTLIQADRPDFRTMTEEIFGPVLTVYVYPDDAYDDTLRLCDQTSIYGLTGAVFARDRQAISVARRILVNAAGNFYINDKPTGAVVGQQPFGGARASGTNDKAGSMLNLYRWLSPRTIKENFNPPVNYRYPLMDQA